MCKSYKKRKAKSKKIGSCFLGSWNDTEGAYSGGGPAGPALDIPLYHYTTIPLYHYTTIPLYHYTTIPLYHYTTIPLYHYTTIPLYHYTTIPLYHYTTIPLYKYCYCYSITTLWTYDNLFHIFHASSKAIAD